MGITSKEWLAGWSIWFITILPAHQEKNISFHLPDTFAPTDEAYPKILKNFQSFNLKICAENKALSNKISIPLYFDFLKLLISGGCSFSSASKLIFQVIKEKFNSKYCSRRSLMQPILSFDLYFKCLNKYQPNFSTFFSNHVAGIIHRYWRDIFPEDFIDDSYRISDFNKDSVIKAMDISDDHICRLLKYCKKNNAELWIASSMSQKARKDVYLPWDIQLENFSLLSKFFNLKHQNYSLLPAMQPDICIQCKTYEDLYSLNSVISKIRDKEGNQIILERYKKDNSINISLRLTQILLSTETLIIDKNEFKLKDLGLKLINRDPGTAYHTPEGILIKYERNTSRDFSNENQILDTTLIAPMILEYFGIDPKILIKFIYNLKASISLGTMPLTS